MTEEKKDKQIDISIKELKAKEKSLLFQLKHVRKEIKELNDRKKEEEELKLVENLLEEAKKKPNIQFLYQPGLLYEEEGILMTFIDKHFEVSEVEITYRVRTSENTTLNIKDYNGKWTVDEEIFENIQDFDLSFYIQLYYYGDKLKKEEDVNKLGTSEDFKNLYGIGTIEVGALVLKLKSS
jgi:hypothetical protein